MKKKLENFFYYYKFHMVAVLFVIILIVVLTKDSNRTRMKFVLADSTSQLSMENGSALVEEFRKKTDLDEEEARFRYRTMYLEEGNIKEVDFDIAGIDDYEDCFKDGTIDFAITTADEIWKIAEAEEATGEEETQIAYAGSENVIFLDDFFSESELEVYEEYLYYVNDTPVGLVFDTLPKVEKYFGDDYPSDSHYVLQIAKGADSYTKEFLEFLIEE